MPAGTLSVADAMGVLPPNTLPPAAISGGVVALHVTVVRAGQSQKEYQVIRSSVEGSSTDVKLSQLERT